MRVLSYIIVLLLIVIGLSFAILNAGSVTLNYYVGKGSISLSLLLVFTLAVGIIIGMLSCFKPWFSLKRENRSLRSRIRNTEKEIENLRTIPLKDSH